MHINVIKINPSVLEMEYRIGREPIAFGIVSSNLTRCTISMEGCSNWSRDRFAKPAWQKCHFWDHTPALPPSFFFICPIAFAKRIWYTSFCCNSSEVRYCEKTKKEFYRPSYAQRAISVSYRMTTVVFKRVP